MTALTTAAPRLRKLVLLLSSDHDGEVVSAARAIGRMLKDAGADWHALADAINLSNAAHVQHLCPPWQRMASVCRSQGHRLSSKEFDFVSNLAMATREPSEKQLKWLRDIFQRLQVRA